MNQSLTPKVEEEKNMPVNELDRKVDSVLNMMTLKEKIGQMNQYSGFRDFTGPVSKTNDAASKTQDIRDGLVGSMLNVRGVENVRAVQKIAVEETRLGIPLIFGFDVIHGYQTMAPIPLAEAASWDLEAIQNSSRLAAKEAAAAGLNWTFAPMVDISRDARWGRVMEGAGEDPYLGSRIATARVNGFQGNELSDRFTIAACAKHFSAYGFSEAGREYNTVDIGNSTLYNVVLPPFKAAVDAGARTFMSSFNDLNGIPASANEFLFRDILKNQWGFEGFVVSDWASIKEMINHHYAPDDEAAARLSVNAGIDMDMESYVYMNHLEQLVGEGKVPVTIIDDAVKRILKVKFELGLFDDPYKYCDEVIEKQVINSEEMKAGALDMALKSIVLLKNENEMLPLKRGRKIAVLGDLAIDKNSVLGNWRIGAIDDTAISLKEGIANYTENTVVFERGPVFVDQKAEFTQELIYNKTDTTGTAAALKAAENADVVIVMLGEHGLQSGEARSRTDLGLPGLQQEFLEQIHAVNPNIVLVLTNGRPLALPWAKKNIPAIVEAWQLGSQSGHAIAQVLHGDYNPSGKLPMTFPVDVGQVPIYYNHKNTGRPDGYNEGTVFYSHYQDAPNEPLWPFGFGLSYTTFKYDDVQVDNNYSQNQKVVVTAQISNTGDVAGTEIVQLYIQDEFATTIRPVKELKGFEKVTLQPGESRQVSFELTRDQLGFFNNQGDWILENGAFKVWIGGSSQAKLMARFTLEQ
ncbi:beta-glucosidase [Nonlabens sp. YIK11]|uniref:beta-glucosidase BglX n=1 Tax=Nonlabens sp. YIK11 TaxID=1453349 RepID=UPI000707EB96|nr:beta-glucosidase BglX [Nonlabens sp. YIK11]KQC32979.1 beta-glucosidase [Nonlabens sp. YIK11]